MYELSESLFYMTAQQDGVQVCPLAQVSQSVPRHACNPYAITFEKWSNKSAFNGLGAVRHSVVYSSTNKHRGI